MTRRLELAGQRFGRLVAIEPGPNQRGRVTWHCQCDCGGESWPHATSLISGNSKSCGCLGGENLLKAVTKHGQTGSPEYRAWLGAKARCYRSTLPGYADWGGRGITVCDRWLNSYESFLADMGPRPSPAYSLDRIDNDLNYEPGNCRWATIADQTRNRRSNIWVTLDGKRLTAKDGARAIGVDEKTVYRRLKQGWSFDEVRRHYRPN